MTAETSLDIIVLPEATALLFLLDPVRAPICPSASDLIGSGPVQPCAKEPPLWGGKGGNICVPFAMLQGPSVSCSNESQQWQQNFPAAANPQPQPLTAPQPSGEWLPTAPESPADAVEASLGPCPNLAPSRSALLSSHTAASTWDDLVDHDQLPAGLSLHAERLSRLSPLVPAHGPSLVRAPQWCGLALKLHFCLEDSLPVRPLALLLSMRTTHAPFA